MMRLNFGFGRLGAGPALPAPSLNLNLMADTLDSRITFARASTATRINSAGVIESVSSGASRLNFSATSIGTPFGRLAEEGRTNLLLNSLLNGTSLATQDVAVTAQAYTLSFYGTGTIELSGAHTATVEGTGAYPSRRVLTFTPSAATLTLTVTGAVQFAQLEAGALPTSFIPTAGSSVARAAETFLMTGAAFSSWFNAAQGTFLVECAADYPTAGSTKAPFSASDASTSSIFPFISTGGTIFTQARAAGVDQAVINTGAFTAATVNRIAVAYAANDFVGCRNGQAVATDTSGTVPTVDQLSLGYSVQNSGLQLNGHLRMLKYWPVRLPDGVLRNLTGYR